MNAKYYLTGNGTTVVENLIVDGNANMTTVYHLDGADLRATHYCSVFCPQPLTSDFRPLFSAWHSVVLRLRGRRQVSDHSSVIRSRRVSKVRFKPIPAVNR